MAMSTGMNTATVTGMGMTTVTGMGTGMTTPTKTSISAMGLRGWKCRG